MKHHASGRPVGKCKGCCLNMRLFCAAGLEPKTQWSSKGRCGSYGDQELLRSFMQAAPLTGAKAAKLQRRIRAARDATVPHYNGDSPPLVLGARF